MSIFINKTDLVGRYRIAVSTANQQHLDEFLTQVEKQVIVEDFETDFYAEAEVEPTKDKFQDLLVKGYKDYLLGNAYFYIQRDNFMSSAVGNVKMNSQNSSNVTDQFNAGLATDRFNLGISFYNRETLPFLNENAEQVATIENSVDNGNGTFDLTLSKNTYLSVANSLFIDNIEYLIENLVGLVVTVTIAVDPIGKKAKYYPFKHSQFLEKKSISLI